MRAEINKGQILAKFEDAKDVIDEVKKEALRGAAEWIVLRSPVDTGTYMENHTIGAGNTTPIVSSRQSSDGQPRNQPYEPYAQSSLNQMFAQIEGLPEDWKRASIGNTAFHADEVEYEHGYGVFTTLRSAWGAIKQEAVSKAKSKL